MILENIYNQTVTIFNKLRRDDSGTGVDEWKKTVIKDAVWYTRSVMTAGGSAAYIGTYHTIDIPYHEEYLDYNDWRELSDKDSHFTISSGDYVILGEVLEDVNANNIISVAKKYGERCCMVKNHRTLPQRFGAKVQVSIEGV